MFILAGIGLSDLLDGLALLVFVGNLGLGYHVWSKGDKFLVFYIPVETKLVTHIGPALGFVCLALIVAGIFQPIFSTWVDAGLAIGVIFIGSSSIYYRLRRSRSPAK